jgi:hypothetical protein
MRLPVVFRPEARDEVDEAYAWYERQRPGLGEEFLAAVGRSWIESSRTQRSMLRPIGRCGAGLLAGSHTASSTGLRRTAS